MTGNFIYIRNLKGIQKLIFEFPKPGVHVLSAANGSGKTTLLACINRIHNTRALNESFIQHKVHNVDSYDKTSITFINAQQVHVSYLYNKDSDRWNPSPRIRNVLEDAYTRIIYMPALDQRVYIKSGIPKNRMLKSASMALREAMTEVLQDEKFKRLKKANIGETRGRKGSNRRENTAFFLRAKDRTVKGKIKKYFYTENSFSLGELFVLNLLYRVQTIEPDSLLLIDELEVALHPSVQLRLLRYLEKIAVERNLTVLVSTHSSSLIKCAKSLIFIEKSRNGESIVHYDCYSTYALREVTFESDILPDYVFYVEDKNAEYLLRFMIKRYLKEYPEKTDPYWKILPIGDFKTLLWFGQRSRDYLLPDTTGQYIFPDQDVIESLKTLEDRGNDRSKSEERHYQLFKELKKRIKYLHITPELGLLDWLQSNVSLVNESLRDLHQDKIVDFSRLLTDSNATMSAQNAEKPRKAAKKILDRVVEQLAVKLGLDAEKTTSELFQIYCSNNYRNPGQLAELKRTFGPIFSKRGNP